MTQIRYSSLNIFAVTNRMRSVSRQVFAKSMRPCPCSRQVESRPTASSIFITRVTAADKGLNTLNDPNEVTYVSGAFQSKLAIEKIDAERDSHSTGRAIKYSNGANVPAILKSSETLL